MTKTPKPHDDRFSSPMSMGEGSKDFLPELKAGDPNFVQKLAKKTDFKFIDKTKR